MDAEINETKDHAQPKHYDLQLNSLSLVRKLRKAITSLNPHLMA